MTHDSTWLGRTRAMRRKRSAAPFGLLLACILLAGFASTASASTYDMRGEWSIEYKSAGEPPLSETGLIDQMNSGTGAFSGKFKASIGLESSLEGTLSGTTASMTTTTPAPFGTVTFVANAATVDTNANTLSGSGIYYINGKETEPGEVTGKRLKTYQQVQEQLAQEQKEREEREARANVRGEWELTLKAGPETLKGIALIGEEANSKNEFSSSSALFESSFGGTFSGTLKGSEASVLVTTEAAGPVPAGKFTSSTITVTSTGGSMSMSGSGIFTVGEAELPGTLSATRTRTHRQIEEQETQKREAKEKEEREAREAAEKAARELKERQEREAREAVEKAVKPTPVVPPIVVVTPPPVSMLPPGKTLTIGHSGVFSLTLTNPNGSPAHGHLKLTLAKAGKASSAKHHAVGTLGEASFTIAGHGTAVVKMKLSHSGSAELARRKTLHVLITLTTQVDGQPSIGKTFNLTLHAAKPAHGKH
jgi:hypothetical protein